MKPRMLILALVLLLLLACSKKQDPYAPITDTIIDLDEIEKTVETETVQLKVIYHSKWYESDPELKDHFIPWITDIKEGPDSTLYIFDFINSRIVQLSKNGEYIRSIGGPGSGPGEFMHANTNWVRSEKYIYICDISGRRLQIFDRHCNYIRAITNVNIEGRNKFSVASDGALLYSPPFRAIPPVPYMILMHDSLGKEIAKIGAIRENDPVVFTNKIRHSYHIIADEKSKYIWCVFKMAPVIRKYDYNHTFIEQIRYASKSLDRLMVEGQEYLKKNMDPKVVRESSGMVIVETPALLANGDLLLPVATKGNFIISSDGVQSYVKKKIHMTVDTPKNGDNIEDDNIILSKLLGRYYGLYNAKLILKSE